MLIKLSTITVLFCLPLAAHAGQCAKVLMKLTDQLQQIEQAKDQFKFTSDGHIEFDSRGFPHRATYEAAVLARRLSSNDLQRITRSQQDLVNRLRGALTITNQKIFGGENEKLLTTKFSENITPSAANQTLYEYLTSKRYEVINWWMRMDENETGQRNYKGDRIKPPSITINSSKSSILKKQAGGYGSFIFWPIGGRRSEKYYDSKGSWRDEKHIIADLQGPHIRVNVDKDGKEQSIELIARTAAPIQRTWYGKKIESTEWSAFMFEKIGDVWVPRINELNQDKTTRCLSCHFASDGRLSPKPAMLKSVEDFIEVGYRDRMVIEEYLKSF